MDYQCYKQYFLKYAFQPGNTIASFSMSDDDRVIAQSRSTSSYPQLQLDRPTFQPSIIRGGSHTKTYAGSVAILEPRQKDDHAAQEAILSHLESELDQLIAYLDYLKKDKTFRVTQIGAAFPIRMSEMNNLWGWGITFTFEARANFCHDQTADVDVRQVLPQWVDGQTTLALEIGEVTYTSTWNERHLLNQALETLATAINTDAPTTGISAEVHFGTLILIHSDTAATLDLNAPAGGHAWTIPPCDTLVNTPIAVHSNLPIDLSPLISGDADNVILKGADGKLYASSAGAGADGASAYEIWLAEGNVGTEQDFLDSLQGADGEQGEQGPQGEQGIQGETGPQGPAGSGGSNAINAIQIEGGSFSHGAADAGILYLVRPGWVDTSITLLTNQGNQAFSIKYTVTQPARITFQQDNAVSMWGNVQEIEYGQTITATYIPDDVNIANSNRWIIESDAIGRVLSYYDKEVEIPYNIIAGRKDGNGATGLNIIAPGVGKRAFLKLGADGDSVEMYAVSIASDIVYVVNEVADNPDSDDTFMWFMRHFNRRSKDFWALSFSEYTTVFNAVSILMNANLKLNNANRIWGGGKGDGRVSETSFPGGQTGEITTAIDENTTGSLSVNPSNFAPTNGLKYQHFEFVFTSSTEYTLTVEVQGGDIVQNLAVDPDIEILQPETGMRYTFSAGTYTTGDFFSFMALQGEPMTVSGALEVGQHIKIGEFTGTPEAGMLRKNGTALEWYNGISWVVLAS